MKKLLVAACAAALPLLTLADGASTRIVKRTYQETLQDNATARTPLIRYHGGPVMTAPVNTIYVIWYGSFPVTGAANDTRTVLDDFFAHIGGSAQYNVNSTYFDGSGAHIVNALRYDPVATVYDDAYSLGKAPRDSDIATIVKNTITQGHLPADDQAIYFVVTSPDATSRLLSGCAWHDGSKTLVAGHSIKYSSIPVYDGASLQGCSGSVQNFHESNSPNDNLLADNALDSFMHELSEAVSDPLPSSGWVTALGAENGDLCNFNYGSTYIAPNGTHASAHIGSRDYLVQAIWQNTGKGFCANTV